MRGALAAALVTALAGAAGSSAAAAAAPPPWLPPVALSRPMPAVPPAPAVDTGRSGATVVAWTRSVGVGGPPLVEAARRARPAGRFGAPVRLDVGDALAPGAPAVAVRRDGAATVGWIRAGMPTVALLPLTGPAGPAVAIPVAGSAEDLRIGVAEGGATVAAWSERIAGDPAGAALVRVATRAPGATAFDAPVTLGPAGSREPSLDVAGTGAALATWLGPDGAVWAALRPARTTAWEPAVRLSAGGDARAPRAAVADSGDALVAWFEDAPMVASRPRLAATWDAPEPIGPAGRLAPRDAPSVDMSGLGRAVVAWRQGRPLGVRAAMRGDPLTGPDARWSPRRVADGPRNLGAPASRVAFSGDAVVIWSHPSAWGAAVRARVLLRSGRRQPVEAVSRGRGVRVAPALALGTGGAATAAWTARPARASASGAIRVVASGRLRIVP